MNQPKIVVDNDDGICDSPADVTGAQMKTIREVNGLTQVQVAADLGISQGYVADLESGRRRIAPRTAIAFCAIVNAHKDRARRRRSKTA